MLTLLGTLGMHLLGLPQAAEQFVAVDLESAGITNESCYSWSVSWGDYDNDGYIDVVIANTMNDWSGYPNLLYRNNGNGTFTRQFAADVGPVAEDSEPSNSATWADVNSDGRLDLLVFNFAAGPTFPPEYTRLYLNSGSGGFEPATGGDLAGPRLLGCVGALADYDDDRCLDLFMITACDWWGSFTNLLLHGQSDGNFSVVTNGVIALDETPSSNNAAWGDFDNDGDPDLVVANWTAPSFYYRNEGNGQFRRLNDSLVETTEADLANPAAGDFDNDGFLDLAIGSPGATVFFRNTGTGEFTLASEWPEVSKGFPIWGDYDNDGYLDLAVFHGQNGENPIALFHNEGDGSFVLVDDVVTGTSANWISGAWGDYDNDGFLDLYGVEQFGRNALYRNLGLGGGNLNHWLKLSLVGTASNRQAIGAKVRVTATIKGKTLWQLRELSAGPFCQNDPRPNFGLGDAMSVETVRIEWPSGIVQELHGIAANQTLAVTEPTQLLVTGPGSFEIRSWPGQKFEIQGSTDLVTWNPAGVVTNTQGTLTYTDPGLGATPARFYRILAR